jgi:hypothetical protein
MSNQTKAREEGAEHADYRFSLEVQVFLSGEVQENLSLLSSSAHRYGIGSYLHQTQPGSVI